MVRASLKWLTLAVLVIAACGACQTLNAITGAAPQPAATAAAQKNVTSAAAQKTAASATTTQARATNDLTQPGKIYFRISTEGDSRRSDWYVKILAAQTTAGLRPFSSPHMTDGEGLQVSLWADAYHVVVILSGREVFNDWITVTPGETVFVYLTIGAFGGNVVVYEGAEADPWLVQYGPPQRDLTPGQLFDPLRVALIPGWTGLYFGPRNGFAPLGEGRLHIFEGAQEIAVMDPATVRSGHFYGIPVFLDDRTVFGTLDITYTYPDGTVSSWPDGRRFFGRYYGLNPLEGEMTLPDGRRWKGKIKSGEPDETGDYSLVDGTLVFQVPAIDIGKLDGIYDCVTPDGVTQKCYFFEGDWVPSPKDYQDKVDDRDGVTPPPPPPPPPPPLPTPEPPPEPEEDEVVVVPAPVDPVPVVNGCTRVEGDFTADAGYSKLNFDGNGSGHMWQRTYGGLEVYTFDIDFAYRGTQDSMRFDYTSPAIYKDLSGTVLRTIDVPGGDSTCAYNGRVLTINGKEFVRN